ncbi:MAG: NADH-quinone oxidoreductase subunit A [Planctomycetota bacterium]|nr:NADH-quinone oxidoreductase subunit A [Planctomycetota bacterium]
MYFEFANVLVFTVVAVGFIVANLGLARLLRPKSTTEPNKVAIYECGEPTVGQAWIRFDIRFYTVALMFVIFDVEIALLFPWGAVFRDLAEQGMGTIAFIEAGTFILILMVGLAYVWARGDIDWTDVEGSRGGGGKVMPERVPSADRPVQETREPAVAAAGAESGGADA